MGVYILYARRGGKKDINHNKYERRPGQTVGVTNPIALPDQDEDYNQSLNEKELLATVIQ